MQAPLFEALATMQAEQAGTADAQRLLVEVHTTFPPDFLLFDGWLQLMLLCHNFPISCCFYCGTIFLLFIVFVCLFVI